MKISRIFIIFFITACRALEIEYLWIPRLVKIGDATALVCKFDLKDEVLYSVMWLKDNEIFYRFVPGQRPQKHSYPVEGVTIDLEISTEQITVLTNMTAASEGLYRCEVSAEAPSFTTATTQAYLQVTSLSNSDPEITGLDQVYKVGDIVALNCSTRRSLPDPELTWFVNGQKVKGTSLTDSSDAGFSTKTSVITFTVTDQFLTSDRIYVRCQAVWPSYKECLKETEAELYIVDEKTSLLVQVAADNSARDLRTLPVKILPILAQYALRYLM